MTEQKHEIVNATVQQERRKFLIGIGKWSQAVVAGVALGGTLAMSSNAHAWGWGNRSGGGNAAWVNFGGGGAWGPGWNNWGGWNNGGWFNRPWHNRGWNDWGGWNNRGGWHNRGGGGGRGWFNGPGWGGSWMNNR